MQHRVCRFDLGDVKVILWSSSGLYDVFLFQMILLTQSVLIKRQIPSGGPHNIWGE